jgi:hypothetical protein
MILSSKVFQQKEKINRLENKYLVATCGIISENQHVLHVVSESPELFFMCQSKRDKGVKTS